MSLTKQRLLAALLCAVMALGLCIPAGAAPAMLGDDYCVAETPMDIGGQVLEAQTSSLERPTLVGQDEQAELLAAGQIYHEGGAQESAYIQWTIADGVTSYKVSVKEKSASTWTQLDDALIRRYPGYMRADALGLKAGTYQMKVTPNTGAEMISGDLVVKAHERTGYGFVGGTASGAYNEDGTLKSNAKVIYVDNKNFNTIKWDVTDSKGKPQTMIGVQGIVNEGGASKHVPGTPVCIRVLGTIDTTGFPKSAWGSSAEGLQVKGKGVPKNLTIEGVGNDAVFNGFGMLIRASQNVEVRNLGLFNFADDGISIDTDNSNLWIHNNDFFYGNVGSDADQAKGDGALDTKASTNITHSYNHFWDSGKCNLQGMKSESTSNCITYHHNWFDHSDSRHPRVRTCTVHVYNNYYDGNAKYGVGATMGCSIFVENNYFRSCKNPMLTSKQGTDAKGDGTFSGENGGVIKEFGNVMEGSYTYRPYSQNSTDFDAYDAGSRSEKVPDTVKAISGGTTYSNFDTDSGFYRYTVQSAAEARDTVRTYAGRVEGGDFKFTFNNAVEDTNYDVIPALKSAVTNYEGTMISVGGSVDGSSGTGHNHTYTYTVTKAATCTVPGVETGTCSFPGCGETVTREIPTAPHKYQNGTCSVCGAKEGSGGSGGSGGTTTPGVTGISKNLKASDFKMTAFTDGTAKKTSALTADELDKATSGYFTMYGNVNKRIPKAGAVGDTVQYFDLLKEGTNGFTFTVSDAGAPATLTVNFGSAGQNSDKTDRISSVGLKKADGAVVNTDAGASYATAKGKTAANAVYSELPAGTYTIVGTSDNGATHAARLYTATVIETTSETEHDWGEWTTVRAATCGKDGLDQRTCSKCGTKDYRYPPATEEHIWGAWSDPDGDGVKTRTCTVCGAEGTEGGTVTPPATTVDKTALNKAIEDAAAAKVGVVTSADGKDVATTVYWVTTAQFKTLNSAIADAEAVATKTDATQAAVDAAAKALSAAVTTFKGQKALGTKSAGGTGDVYDLLIADVVKGLGTNPPAGWTATAITLGADPLTGQGGSGFFTLYAKDKGTSGSKFDTSKKTFSDGALTDLFNPGGKVGLNEAGDKIVNAIGFTTTGAATVKVWWVGGKSTETRHMAIVDSKGAEVAVSTEGSTGTATISTMALTAEGTYYLGGKENNNNVYKVQVTVAGGDAPVVIDKTALNKALTDAASAKAGVVTSADGKDVDKATYWVTAAQLKTLNDAITAAEDVAIAAVPTQKAVDDAAKALNDAITAFKAQKALGTKETGTVTPPTTTVDTKGLEAAIAAAEKFKAVKVDTAAANVPKGESWVTQATMNDLLAAIDTAKKALTAETQAQVSAAATALNQAVDKFVQAAQEGTKEGGSTTPASTHTFESKTLTVTAAGNCVAGPYAADNYFTLATTNKTKYDESKKEWKADAFGANAYDPAGDGGKSNVVRFNMGGKTTADGPAIKFTTTSDNAKVQVWWVQNGGDSQDKTTQAWTAGAPYQIALLKADATQVDASKLAHTGATAGDEGRVKKNDPEYTELTAATAGTYMVGSLDGSNYIFKIVVTEGSGSGTTTPSVDKSALTAAIAAAEAAKALPAISKDGADVAPAKKWVTQVDYNTFLAAINAAKAAKLVAATAQEVTQAVSDLKAAQSAFEAAQKAGTQGQGAAVTGVTLSKTSASVNVGKTLVLTATVKPSNATNKGVYWTSSDTSIVTVDQEGKLTGVKAGTAKVTVETLEGKFTATCNVTVSTGSSSGGSHGGGGGGGGGAAPAPSTGLPFVDVAANAWYHDSVKKVYDLGLMKGTDGTHFAPNTNTSRAMVATVLYRLDGEKGADVKSLFSDVAAGSWYAKAVEWAAAKGVVKGYDANTFAPDDNVTREQLAVMLYRYAAPAAKSEKDLSAFTDAASVSDWALEAITWAVDKGIMNGKGNGRLDPKGLATRAEICTMLVRFTELKK